MRHRHGSRHRTWTTWWAAKFERRARSHTFFHIGQFTLFHGAGQHWRPAGYNIGSTVHVFGILSWHPTAERGIVLASFVSHLGWHVQSRLLNMSQMWCGWWLLARLSLRTDRWHGNARTACTRYNRLLALHVRLLQWWTCNSTGENLWCWMQMRRNSFTWLNR